MPAKKMKTSDKAKILTKLTTTLKKKYGGKAPKADRAVLESYLFAACLENEVDEAADAAYSKLLDAFHDLNEIRVSTVLEIERPLSSLADPEFRAMRIREGLQHVFEKHFAFDLDSLKKKNLDGALSDLGAMTGVTPFIKLYTLQVGLGAHVIPLDSHQFDLLVWLGLVEPKTKVETASDELKGAVRKSDGPLFAYLLRQVANEPDVIEDISLTEDDGEISPDERLKSLEALLSGKRKPAVKAKAAAKKKTAAKKKAAAKKKTAPAKKTSAKKTAAKKSAPKKAAKKKTAPGKKKAAGKATATKKTAAKKKTKTGATKKKAAKKKSKR